ncbi:hypothetical protein OG21DRAFT_1370384, partial [Imleria badia]
QADVFGRVLWLSIDVVVMLTEAMRHCGEENQEFMDLLFRLLLENVQPSWKDDKWLGAPIIVPSNDAKDALNERAILAFAQRTGQQVHWYESID